MKRRRPPDEPGFISTRVDADSYADDALASLLRGVALSQRQQGFVREWLVTAYDDGETQGEFRALWILMVAEHRAPTADARALIRRCMRLLAPDVRL